MFHFYIHLKRQKAFVFLTLSGSMEMEHWTKMDYQGACFETEAASGRCHWCTAFHETKLKLSRISPIHAQ